MRKFKFNFKFFSGVWLLATLVVLCLNITIGADKDMIAFWSCLILSSVWSVGAELESAIRSVNK